MIPVCPSVPWTLTLMTGLASTGWHNLDSAIVVSFPEVPPLNNKKYNQDCDTTKSQDGYCNYYRHQNWICRHLKQQKLNMYPKYTNVPALWPLAPSQGQFKDRVSLCLGKQTTKFLLPSLKRYPVCDLQEKRGRKCQCTLECKSNHFLVFGYICTYAYTNVTSR